MNNIFNYKIVSFINGLFNNINIINNNKKFFSLQSLQKRADVPLAWGLYFQDGASPSFEGIVDLHNRIMFYLVIILFGVT